MKNFIEEYLRLTARAESPTSYLRWGAISCLSAVLRDNVWFSFPERMTRLYPNIYVLIIGDSAVVRKSTPFDINERLLRGDKGVNNTKVMAGQATMQGVLKVLANTENGQPNGGSGIMLSSEASAFFIQDPMTVPMLTQLYDFKPFYDKHLAAYDIPPIKNVCLSMFAGTNEIMIQRMLDKTAKEGGFLGRCIIIQETKRRHKDSGFEEDRCQIKEEEWEPMTIFLKQLATVKGPISLSTDARKLYVEWYHGFEIEEYRTETGYEGRLQSHILKLATILTAAKPDFKMVIEVEELEQAIEECTALLMVYKKMTFGTGIAPTSSFIIQITNQLLEAKNNHMSRRQLMYNLHGNITGQSLDEVMKDLVDAEFVIEQSITGAPGYKLTEKFLHKFRRMGTGPNSNHKGAAS